MNTFNELNLPAELQRALSQISFTTPTPIQAQAIPACPSRPRLHCLRSNPEPARPPHLHSDGGPSLGAPTRTALILAPTRELALQIDEFWKQLTLFTPDLKSVTLIGGASHKIQLKHINRGARVIDAAGARDGSPRARHRKFEQHGFLVLDEADRMLDMGFEYQLQDPLASASRSSSH